MTSDGTRLSSAQSFLELHEAALALGLARVLRETSMMRVFDRHPTDEVLQAIVHVTSKKGGTLEALLRYGDRLLAGPRTESLRSSLIVTCAELLRSRASEDESEAVSGA